MSIYDMLYCGDDREEVEAMVREDFPNAIIEDASDFVHQGRFTVTMDGKREDWILWVLRKGIIFMSFDFQMSSMDEPEFLKPLVELVIDEHKANESS